MMAVGAAVEGVVVETAVVTIVEILLYIVDVVWFPWDFVCTDSVDVDTFFTDTEVFGETFGNACTFGAPWRGCGTEGVEIR